MKKATRILCLAALAAGMTFAACGKEVPEAAVKASPAGGIGTAIVIDTAWDDSVEYGF